MKLPPKRRGLGNPFGARCTTTAPVPASKPDLRKYPVPRRKPAPEGTTPGERLAFRSHLRVTRPDVTRWRTEHGVCDRDGDTVTYTGECQRAGCGSWFSVQRCPADVNARWPGFCSEDCREIHQATGARRRDRKFRAGETSGARRPKYREFDPSSMTILEAVDLAERIVCGPPRGVGLDRWATDRAYGLAADYLEAYERESASYRS
ncbi:hypothetical protein [Pseudonocardia humida]|uniref:Lsr2 protein n=1 Tax=Pseudonocardia humida TaxID=2800819 RepID=A0ABT1A9P6_9PSEU|nr:hypothetical protein [Pseudonocardia humida]MCO1659681.1 hypothetical protein [Pseudonocardia humida]